MPRLIPVNALRLTVGFLASVATVLFAEHDCRVYPAEPVPSSNVYYVAPNGTWGGTNSYNTPWALQYAANNAQPGWTIVAKDGVYTNGTGLVLSITKSGTSANPIRFVSENRWGAIFDGGYVANFLVMFNGTSPSHIILEGFEIRHARNGGGVWSNRNAGIPSHNTIRGNWIHDNGNHDVSTRSGGRGGSQGIFTGRFERYYTIEGNLLHNNSSLPDPSYNERFYWGMYLKGHGHVIKNNIFLAHDGNHLRVDGDIGASPTPPLNERSFIITNNTFAGSTTHDRKRQIGLYRDGSGWTPRNVLIMNNVFWDNAGVAPVWLGLGGWPWYGTEIINNITTEGGIVFYQTGSSAQFNCGESCDWRRLEENTANGQGAIGMRSPKPQGAVDGDFSLTSSATLLIDQGRALHRRDGLQDVHAPRIDYRGAMRPQGAGPDLGAYEWKP